MKFNIARVTSERLQPCGRAEIVPTARGVNFEIEINTLEELVDLMREVKAPLIISNDDTDEGDSPFGYYGEEDGINCNSILIYDDYIE